MFETTTAATTTITTSSVANCHDSAAISQTRVVRSTESLSPAAPQCAFWAEKVDSTSREAMTFGGSASHCRSRGRVLTTSFIDGETINKLFVDKVAQVRLRASVSNAYHRRTFTFLLELLYTSSVCSLLTTSSTH